MDPIPHEQTRDSLQRAERISRLRALARLLDESIPLPGGFRIGLDPLMGLIPGLGDALSAMFSFYIINEARSIGAPLSVIIRMIGNVLVDGIVGSIPIAGDIFDAAYKGNTRNIELLARYQTAPGVTRRSSRLLVFAALVLLVALLLAIVALPILVIIGIARLF